MRAPSVGAGVLANLAIAADPYAGGPVPTQSSGRHRGRWSELHGAARDGADPTLSPALTMRVGQEGTGRRRPDPRARPARYRKPHTRQKMPKMRR